MSTSEQFSKLTNNVGYPRIYTGYLSIKRYKGVSIKAYPSLSNVHKAFDYQIHNFQMRLSNVRAKMGDLSQNGAIQAYQTFIKR